MENKIDKLHESFVSNLRKPKLEEFRDSKYIIDCTEENFYNWFFRISTNYIKMEYPDGHFILNENNKNVLQQIYYYLTCDEKFEGDLQKGICLCGGHGTLKTITCKTISEIFKYSSRYTYKITENETKDGYRFYGFILVDTEDVNNMSSEQIEFLSKPPIILDELGRNFKVVNDYGTKKTPFSVLLKNRSDNNALTFATANFPKEELFDIYGEYLKERLIKKFNFIELRGKSLRR